jgi:hypothetical protein
MLLDVFNDSAFDLTELTKSINLMPYRPTRIASLGWFASEGISTTSVMVEMDNEVLSLVPVGARGAPMPIKNLPRRNVRSFNTVHLPQRVQLYADEVQNLRAFGSQTEVELGTARINKKLALARRDLDLTIEFQRIGAVKGQVLDADGSTVLLNLFTEFGVSQQVLDFVLDSDTTKVLQKCVTTLRMMEDKLGGTMMSGARALCSNEFFDALTGHPAVADTYRYQMGQVLRSDRRAGFEFGGIFWEEYRGQVGATRFIEANAAYVVPEGVPDFFVTHYAPAPYMETVNTEGLPFYAKQERMDFDKGLDIETQSNPLHLCTRPNAVVKVTI